MHGWCPSSVAAWWRAARATQTFPGHAWPSAWRMASALAEDRDPPARHTGAHGRARPVYDGSRWLRSEPIGPRRCVVCSTDDVAHEGWISAGGRLVCPDCSRAALSGALPYGRFVAAYRGRVGSPRRSLGGAYRALVAFKERDGDWLTLGAPLARALAWSVAD